jgi:hypothetical protein
LVTAEAIELRSSAEAGGKAYRQSSLGIGAEPGHHEHRRPSTSVPTDAGERTPKKYSSV